MHTERFFGASLPLVLGLGARAADAACVIDAVRPEAPLPTMDDGQEFTFRATDDCATLRFRVPGSAFSAIPKPGPRTDPALQTYKVVLTEDEWETLVAETGAPFTWSIVGTTSAGSTTRVTTTNDVKGDRITIDLSSADATFVGERPSNHVGSSLSGPGDVNGDGNDDLLIGVPDNEEGGGGAGAAYLILGPVSGTVELGAADAKLIGNDRFDAVGVSVSGAGDVDDDGNDDLLVGSESWQAGRSAGAAYLVRGPVTGTVDVLLADATLLGEYRLEYAGGSVSGAGDLDGDGAPDLLIGAIRFGAADASYGVAYVVSGSITGTHALTVADARLVGENAYDYAGWCVSDAGDVDGNGLRDVLVGAPANDDAGSQAGAAYLVSGPLSGLISLSGADAKLVGEAAGDYAGRSVSDAGDVDGDGHDDLLIGAYTNDAGSTDAGAAYLVLGPVTGSLSLSEADAKLVGELSHDHAGMSVSGAGDVDGDGHDDLLVGAQWNNAGGTRAGAAYVVRGPVAGTLDLSLADAKLVGEDENDLAGIAVAGAGDVNRDGRDDVLVGASDNDAAGPDAGAAYLIYSGGIW